MTRLFKSDIKIDIYDKWYFHENEITQKDVLLYFRKNLQEDNNGIYIKNSFNLLSEMGYIESKGFPLHIRNIETVNDALMFYTDAEEEIQLSEWELYRTDEDKIFAIKSGNKLLKYKFNLAALTNLGNFIIEKENQFFVKFANTSIAIHKSFFPIEVFLPENI